MKYFKLFKTDEIEKLNRPDLIKAGFDSDVPYKLEEIAFEDLPSKVKLCFTEDYDETFEWVDERHGHTCVGFIVHRVANLAFMDADLARTISVEEFDGTPAWKYRYSNEGFVVDYPQTGTYVHGCQYDPQQDDERPHEIPYLYLEVKDGKSPKYTYCFRCWVD
jgi:hypothetical protein